MNITYWNIVLKHQKYRYNYVIFSRVYITKWEKFQILMKMTLIFSTRLMCRSPPPPKKKNRKEAPYYSFFIYCAFTWLQVQS